MGKHRPPKPNFDRRIVFSPYQFRETLNELDEASNPDCEYRSLRKHNRQAFRAKDIPISFIDGDGVKTNFLVYSRNLSPNGIAIMHGAYVHTGTQCALVLKTQGGEKKIIAGIVCRCRHVKDTCHEIAIKFTDDVSTEKFVQDDPESGLSDVA